MEPFLASTPERRRRVSPAMFARIFAVGLLLIGLLLAPRNLIYMQSR
jgi:hypothetical protein